MQNRSLTLAAARPQGATIKLHTHTHIYNIYMINQLIVLSDPTRAEGAKRRSIVEKGSRVRAERPN